MPRMNPADADGGGSVRGQSPPRRIITASVTIAATVGRRCKSLASAAKSSAAVVSCLRHLPSVDGSIGVEHATVLTVVDWLYLRVVR